MDHDHGSKVIRRDVSRHKLQVVFLHDKTNSRKETGFFSGADVDMSILSTDTEY